jgi:hypothetical protein
MLDGHTTWDGHKKFLFTRSILHSFLFFFTSDKGTCASDNLASCAYVGSSNYCAQGAPDFLVTLAIVMVLQCYFPFLSGKVGASLVAHLKRHPARSPGRLF